MKTTEQTLKHQLLLILALITLATPNLNATQEDNKVRKQLIVYLHQDLEKVPVSEEKNLPYVKESSYVIMKKDNNSEMIMCQKVTIECESGTYLTDVKPILGDGSKNLDFYYVKADTAIKTTTAIDLNKSIFSFKHKCFREKSDMKILTLFTTKEKKITATKITSDSDQDLDKLPFIYKVEDIPLTKKSTGKNKTVAEKKVTILFKKDKGITQEQLKQLLIGDENENEVKRGEKELKFYNEKGEDIQNNNFKSNNVLCTYKPTEYKVAKQGWSISSKVGLFCLFCAIIGGVYLLYHYMLKEHRKSQNLRKTQQKRQRKPKK